MVRAVSPERNRLARQSSSAVARRLDSYPSREWIDAGLGGTALVAAAGEDFDVSREQFIQDLHRIAREETRRLRSQGSETGVVVRTTVRGLGPGEAEFQFFARPIAECPVQLGRDRGPASVERVVRESAGADPRTVAAWQQAVTALAWCQCGGRGNHAVGSGPGCAGREPLTDAYNRIVAGHPQPPAGWLPGHPVPGLAELGLA